MRPMLSCAILALAMCAAPSEAAAGKRKGLAQKRQNLAADADGLTRLKDAAQLARFIRKGLLVEVVDADAYALDPDIGSHDPSRQGLYRYARPWTKAFLDKELAAAPRPEGFRFKITSLVRTQAYQDALCRGGDGAPVCGKRWWERSSHLTGATVDISKEGMPVAVRAWLKKRLAKLQKQGKVIAVEERGCFHVMVLPKYEKKPAKKARR